MINIMSFGSFGGILIGKPERFALTFTLGNIVSILGYFSKCLLIN